MSRSDLDDISKKQETRTAALLRANAQGLYQRLTQTVKAPKIKIFSNWKTARIFRLYGNTFVVY
jgi:hypothetical protein